MSPPALAGLLLACSSAPTPAPQASPVASAPAVSAALSAPPVASDEPPAPAPPRVKRLTIAPWRAPAPAGKASCTRLDAEQARLARGAPKAPRLTETPAASPCQPGSKGAWRLLLTVDSFSVSDDEGMMHPGCEEDDSCMQVAHVTLTPAFAPAGKAPVKGAPHDATLFRGEPGNHDRVDAFDLDGDGIEELLTITAQRGRIFTFRDGKVVPYGPAQGIEFREVVDADGDGRPDLRMDNPYTNPDSAFECGKRGGHPMLNVGVDLTFIAHGRPDGTFALDDDVARRAVLPDCPQRPTVLARASASGTHDSRAVWQNVVCARLWGWTADEVFAALDQQCSRPQDDCEALFDTREGTPTRGCAGIDKLTTWNRLRPPLTLRR